MSIGDFGLTLQVILVNMARFWNMFASLTIGGLPWTRWLLLILGASIILGIVKHSFSDASGVTVSSTVNTSRGDK